MGVIAKELRIPEWRAGREHVADPRKDLLNADRRS